MFRALCQHLLGRATLGQADCSLDYQIPIFLSVGLRLHYPKAEPQALKPIAYLQPEPYLHLRALYAAYALEP